MGKVRTRFIGLEELENQQKEEQKKRAAEKKAQKGADEAHEAEEAVKKMKKKAAPVASGRSRGKKYQAAAKQVDAKKTYSIAAAVETLKKIKFAQFDESVELHLNVDKKGAKGEVSLPHSTGKKINVKIVDDALLEQIEKGNIDFDILIAHPSYMPKLAKFARTLGPKGLIPNPKNGTVSPNPEEAAKKFEGGSLQWKGESKHPLIHQMIGKISLKENEIAENAVAFMQSVGKTTIKQAYIKTSMSPSLQLDMKELE